MNWDLFLLVTLLIAGGLLFCFGVLCLGWSLIAMFKLRSAKRLLRSYDPQELPRVEKRLAQLYQLRFHLEKVTQLAHQR